MALILVTGSSGLVGSAAVDYFCRRGHIVHGIDNNMRMDFFGPEADVRPIRDLLEKFYSLFYHHETDIRNRQSVEEVIAGVKPELIIHAAAQPSHDYAAENPILDWNVNANGTMNLLEATRKFDPKAVFVFLSTNKVYGDTPNRIPMEEGRTRFHYTDQALWGVNETMSIDHSFHSVFGASKAAADVMVQEYGRYFGMKTCCLRCGCMTGPHHAGVELHGFLNYLVKCNVEKRHYKIYGHKGKQVRDNIHAVDVIRFIEQFWASPRSAAVYNMGGGFANSCSILEAIDLIQTISRIPMDYEYVDKPRLGDHICYYTDLRRACHDYENWQITMPLKDTIKDIYDHYDWKRKSAGNPSQPG